MTSPTLKAFKKLPQKMGTHCEEVAGILKILSHPQRLMVLSHLSQGEKTVGELQGLCERSQSQMSQFLGRMKSEGLVQARRDGHFVYYSIADARLKTLLGHLTALYCTPGSGA